MFRVLRLILLIILVLTLFAFAGTLIVDPGEPDHLIIGTDITEPGQTATIPILVGCDTDVGHLNIPMLFDNNVLQYDSSQMYGTIVNWDVVWFELRPGDSIISIIAWCSVSGPPRRH